MSPVHSMDKFQFINNYVSKNMSAPIVADIEDLTWVLLFL